MVNQVLDSIIDTLNEYQEQLTSQEDLKLLSPKYRQGVLDGIGLCIEILTKAREQHKEKMEK